MSLTGGGDYNDFFRRAYRVRDTSAVIYLSLRRETS